MISTIAAFALAIAEQEHTPAVWHNKCALTYTGQRGASKGPGGYAVWQEPNQACERDLMRKRERGMTWEQIARRWSMAPDSYAPKVMRRFRQLAPRD